MSFHFENDLKCDDRKAEFLESPPSELLSCQFDNPSAKIRYTDVIIRGCYLLSESAEPIKWLLVSFYH